MSYRKMTIPRRLNRLVRLANRMGWNITSISDTEVVFVKVSSYVDIVGNIVYRYNAIEHSVTTTLIHDGIEKTLKRNIKTNMWNPVETLLKYPRTHVGVATLSYEYLSK